MIGKRRKLVLKIRGTTIANKQKGISHLQIELVDRGNAYEIGNTTWKQNSEISYHRL